MTDTVKFVGAVVLATVIAVLLIVIVVPLLPSRKAPPAGAAATGLLGSVATTSQFVLPAATSIQLIATSTCTARVVSTGASPVLLTFSDVTGQAPNGGFGYWQGASSTVNYDGGTYGCGVVKVWSQTAGNVTFSDVR